ncbi:hypothetical protein CC2G_014350 [Coprinopsis cinerea AmutBmut pab1-1]|nr:hypothetical protein CC2G_014350 [Coprinopsis cinerea AmutBmut pab1-1]
MGAACRESERVYRGPLNDPKIVPATSDSEAKDNEMKYILRHTVLPQHIERTPSPYHRLQDYCNANLPVPPCLKREIQELKYSNLKARTYMGLKNAKKRLHIAKEEYEEAQDDWWKEKAKINLTLALKDHNKLKQFMKRKGWV